MGNWSLDLGALIAIGIIAATMFWRLLCRLERKIDRMMDTVVTKHECYTRHAQIKKEFDHHFHIPDDGVGVVKGV